MLLSCCSLFSGIKVGIEAYSNPFLLTKSKAETLSSVDTAPNINKKKQEIDEAKDVFIFSMWSAQAFNHDWAQKLSSPSSWRGVKGVFAEIKRLPIICRFYLWLCGSQLGGQFEFGLHFSVSNLKTRVLCINVRQLKLRACRCIDEH